MEVTFFEENNGKNVIEKESFECKSGEYTNKMMIILIKKYY